MQAKIEAGDPPGFVVDWPDVDSDLVDVWQAWHRMAGDRSGGMDVSGTPFAAIDRYAARYEMDDFEVFHRLILAMDDCYVSHINKRRDSG